MPIILSIASIAISITAVMKAFKGKFGMYLVFWIVGFLMAVFSLMMCEIK